MNFLQLVARLNQEVGATDSAPATVLNQNLDIARLVSWINTAWMDIQGTNEDWEWMRSTASFTTVAGQATYTPTQCGLTNFGAWGRNTFRCYTTSVGVGSEQFLDYVDYEGWRNTYQFSTMRSQQTQPNVMTITPDKSIGLGPVPAAGYTILGSYYTVPSEMALDADIPALPTQFHMMIVYRAMMSYGAFESAAEVYQRGETEFKKMLRRLTMSRLPEVVTGGPLV